MKHFVSKVYEIKSFNEEKSHQAFFINKTSMRLKHSKNHNCWLYDVKNSSAKTALALAMIFQSSSSSQQR